MGKKRETHEEDPFAEQDSDDTSDSVFNTTFTPFQSDDPDVPESFIDLGTDLGEVPDLVTVPDGEYQLTLISLERKESKEKKKPMLMARFEITGRPDTKMIIHILMLPTSFDDERTTGNRQRSIKSFYKAFGLPLSGKVYFDGYLGKTGWALLAEEDDNEYGMQNRIRRFITGD